MASHDELSAYTNRLHGVSESLLFGEHETTRSGLSVAAILAQHKTMSSQSIGPARKLGVGKRPIVFEYTSKNEVESKKRATTIETFRYDFSESDDFKFVKLVSCMIGGRKYSEKNLVRLFCAIIETEIRHQNPLFPSLRYKHLCSEDERPFLMNNPPAGVWCVALSTRDWIQTEYSKSQLLERIGLFCLHCGYSEDEISIVIEGIRNKTLQSPPPQTSIVDEVESSVNDDACISVTDSEFTAHMTVGDILADHSKRAEDEFRLVDEDASLLVLDDESENESEEEPYEVEMEYATSLIEEKERKMARTQSGLPSWVHVTADSFTRYLKNVENKSDSTCHGYARSITACEVFAREHGLRHTVLYTDDRILALKTVGSLLEDPEFLDFNANNHYRYRTALNFFRSFIKCGVDDVQSVDFSEEVSSEICDVPVEQCHNEPYENVLRTYFAKGFRLGSPIEIRRFRKIYAEVLGANLQDDDRAIESCIRRLCLVHEGRAFLLAEILSDDAREKLLGLITRHFENGREAVYYAALYSEANDILLDSRICTVEMLKTYLSAIGAKYIQETCLSRTPNFTPDIKSEVAACLVNFGRPTIYAEIYAALPHLAQDKIRQELGMNGEFISNAPGTYFHESLLALSVDELAVISSLIAEEIATRRYLAGNELYEILGKRHPQILEPYGNLSQYGFRDALKFKLRDRFSFTGNIISAIGNRIDMRDVFADFARTHERFSLNELRSLAGSLSTTIYFDAVYANSIRVSADEFVSPGLVHFDFEQIDEALNHICIADYLTIREVDNFSIFPDVGFAWNEFLLSHYVWSYSARFKFFRINFSASDCTGIIVRRSSQFHDFDDVVVNALAKSGIELIREPALEFLHEWGFVSRRRYEKIDELLMRAQTIRNA